MAYIQKHNYKGVFKMGQDKMTPNARPAVMPKPVPKGGAANNFAKERKAMYGDVMDKQGKPILNPLKLFTSNKFNNFRWEGRMMDGVVEGVKNAVIPGRFFQKARRAYKYNKITKNKY